MSGGKREVFLGEASLLPLIMRRTSREGLPKLLGDLKNNFMLRPEAALLREQGVLPCEIVLSCFMGGCFR